MFSREILEETKYSASIENLRTGTYAKRFKNWGSKPRLEPGENVKSENIKGKQRKGRFIYLGTVIQKCIEKSYLIKDDMGKIRKKNIKDLKKVISD